jgi:hypothetical protein
MSDLFSGPMKMPASDSKTALPVGDGMNGNKVPWLYQRVADAVSRPSAEKKSDDSEMSPEGLGQASSGPRRNLSRLVCAYLDESGGMVADLPPTVVAGFQDPHVRSVCRAPRFSSALFPVRAFSAGTPRADHSQGRCMQAFSTSLSLSLSCAALLLLSIRLSLRLSSIDVLAVECFLRRSR